MLLATLILRLALAVVIAFVALVGLVRLLGWVLDSGGIITYEGTDASDRSQIYALDVNRGFVASLTTGRVSNASHSAWSPDGRRMAFVSFAEPGHSSAGDVYMIDMSTGALHRLALQTLASDETFIQNLAWSPDGRSLAIVGLLGNTWGVFVADANGGDLQWVSDVEGTRVVWSPDGRRLALNAPIRAERSLFDIGVDGSNLRLLSEDFSWMGSQAWSPDGRQIIFSTFEGIHVVTIAGDRITRQHISPAGYLPAWSPDGKRIAFVEADDSPSLYIMNPDGSDVRRLLVGGSGRYVYDLAWSPDGTWLALESECQIGGDEFVSDLCLYTVNADDGHVRRIPIQVDPRFAGRFAWQP